MTFHTACHVRVNSGIFLSKESVECAVNVFSRTHLLLQPRGVYLSPRAQYCPVTEAGFTFCRFFDSFAVYFLELFHDWSHLLVFTDSATNEGLGSRETGHFVRLYVATQICLGVERLCVRPNQCYVEFTLSCSVHSSNTEFDLITGDNVMSLCIEDRGRIQWKLFCLFVGF